MSTSWLERLNTFSTHKFNIGVGQKVCNFDAYNRVWLYAFLTFFERTRWIQKFILLQQPMYLSCYLTKFAGHQVSVLNASWIKWIIEREHTKWIIEREHEGRRVRDHNSQGACPVTWLNLPATREGTAQLNVNILIALI